MKKTKVEVISSEKVEKPEEDNSGKNVILSESNKPETSEGILISFFKHQPSGIRIFFLLAFIVLGAAALIAICYFGLYRWQIDLYNWGLTSFSWKSILAVIGSLFLLVSPLLTVVIFQGAIIPLLQIEAEESKQIYDRESSIIEKNQARYEDVLDDKDEEGLIPLATYSRIELEQYYKMGLIQSQKSYKYSINAMWIGFVIIIFGILLYLLSPFFGNKQNHNIELLTIISGVIIEFISALFLWIYKSSTKTSTYFYERQIFIHNVLLAHRISKKMNEPDVAKLAIVNNLLSYNFKNRASEDIKLENEKG